MSESFYFEKKWKNYLMKDFTNLYLPKDEKTDYKQSINFLINWIKVVRTLLNWDKPNKNNEYLKLLKEINFPFNDSKSLKKLLEFQKFIFKVTLPVIDNLDKKSKNNTDNFINKIHNYIKDSAWYEEWINFKLTESKWFYRTSEKVIKNYWWDIEQIADSTRATIFWDNLSDLSTKISDLVKWLKKEWWIKSIRFEDKIWNIFKKAGRPNWYRDATLAITNKDWTTVEIQFHLKSQYAIKTGNLIVSENNWSKILNLDDKWFKIKNYDIWEKIESENIRFTDIEKEVLIDYCFTTGFKIPKSFAVLFDIEDESIIDNNEKFNTDFTYKLERTLWKIDEQINNKLLTLDRILFDIADGDLAIKEIKRIMKWYETKK